MAICCPKGVDLVSKNVALQGHAKKEKFNPKGIQDNRARHKIVPMNFLAWPAVTFCILHHYPHCEVLFRSDADIFGKACAKVRIIDTEQFNVVQGYEVDPPGQANLAIGSNAIGQEFKCLSFTLEMPFKVGSWKSGAFNFVTNFHGWANSKTLVLLSEFRFTWDTHRRRRKDPGAARQRQSDRLKCMWLA